MAQNYAILPAYLKNKRECTLPQKQKTQIKQKRVFKVPVLYYHASSKGLLFLREVRTGWRGEEARLSW